MSEQLPTSEILEASEVLPHDPTWRLVREALRGLQFGTVTLIVQDGLVIQVDRTQRTRVASRRK